MPERPEKEITRPRLHDQIRASAPAVRDIRKVITTTAANPGIAQLAQRVAQVL